MTQDEIKTDRLAKVLSRILAEIVLNPKALSVGAAAAEGFATVRITCASSDTGKIIGRSGSHFRALQAICNAWGARNGLEVELRKIAEAGDHAPKPYPRFQSRADWPKEKLVDLAEAMAFLVFKDDTSILVDCLDDSEDSTIKISVARDEPVELVKAMGTAFHVLLRAAGNLNGRMLSVRIAPVGEPSRQPVGA